QRHSQPLCGYQALNFFNRTGFAKKTAPDFQKGAEPEPLDNVVKSKFQEDGQDVTIAFDVSIGLSESWYLHV
ncbi:MAG TPA: hypothetical protein VGD14_06225, partial [bacterium]